jgi:protein-tyrosine phosphatase
MDGQLEHPVAGHNVSYLVDPPDSVLAALRAVGEADGAALVHCAAGKDRTGTIVALALMTAGADRDPVIDDNAASTERAEAIVGRLMASNTYADNLRDRRVSANKPTPRRCRSSSTTSTRSTAAWRACSIGSAGRPRTTPGSARSCGTEGTG